MLLDGLTIVPMDGPAARPIGAVRRAAVRLDGDRIAAVGDLEPRTGEARIDCRGLTATPGFVQTHVHFCQTLFRGLCDDLPLLRWLRERVWPLEAAHDEASVRASAELSIAELLRGGTTTVQVMETVRHTEASFAAAAASGMTTILGNCLMDVAAGGIPEALTTTAAEGLRIGEQLRAAFHGQGRLRYAVSPRFLLSCTEELGHAAADFAARHRLRVHTHAAEHPGEVAEVRRLLGRDYVVALGEQGLLGPHTGLAHCVHLSAAERALLAERRCAVLHCPSANLKLGSGIAPVAALRRLGVRVGLGADGAPCNNRLSALTELRLAALLQAVREGPSVWPAEQALDALTRGGADALGLADELGSIAPGKRADLVLFDLGSFDLEPGGAPASKIVYSASERHVRHVLLGGEFAVRDGELLRHDAARIAAESSVQRRRLLQRAGLSA